MASPTTPTAAKPPPPRDSSTPLEEGDITHARGWLAKDESGNSRQDSLTSWKGKGRAADLAELDIDNDEVVESPQTSAYPPVNDDEAETRRIEENLRRWEIAERQKRKAARDASYKESPSSPSIVEGVTRRASALWLGKSKRPSGSGLGLGNHTVLQSEEHGDVLPLTDIASPTPSPTRSESDETHPDGPFADPPEAMSPFADAHEIPTRAPSTSPPIPDDSALPSPPPHASSRHSRQPPPPKPLGLPPPRAPPPPIATSAYPATPSPDVSRRRQDDDDDVKETRWWHEWLCGFGEGPDRGGDHQAGRTNPFE